MSVTQAEIRNAIIGGESVPAATTFPVLNPATGEPLAEVARCGAKEIDQAVSAARHTYETAWRKSSAVERARILRRIGDLVERNSEQLARLETLDTGKPLSQGRADVRVATRYFEYYADTVEALFGDTVPGPSEVLIYTLNEPFGVTGHIIPWNYPIQISARTAAPALAAGNCCVLKPAEEAPLTSLRLAELALEAGLPAGALNVVPGMGDEAGAALAAHRGIDHLAFTGSVEVGQIVSRAAAENVIPVTLELGGKSPNLVLADADLEAAAPVIVNSIIQNAGQTCSAGSRLLVAQPVHDRLVELVADRMGRISIGPGLDDPQLGPLISSIQRDRVRGFVESVGSDVRLVCGGSPPEDEALRSGYFFQPTLFDGVASDSKLGQEEVFGPVLAVTAFDDLDQAVLLANATDYGLLAAIWTQDVGRAHWLAREVRAGQVYINTYGAGGGVELPFGGFKRSGHGREKGFEALRAYTQTKTVAVKLAGA